MPVLRLVTELDALLDTRQGLMDVLDPDACVRLVSNPAYYTREIDHFEALCGFPDADFHAEWARRDIRALQHALATPSVDMLRVNLLEAHRVGLRDPSMEGIVLEVNCHPYTHTAVEKQMLSETLQRVLGHFFTLHVVDKPWNEYSPDVLRRDYAGLILYNHQAWMQANYEALKVRGCPQVSLIAPKLLGKPMDPADRVVEGKELDVFYASAIVSRHLIAFDFIDVGNFCLPHDPT